MVLRSRLAWSSSRTLRKNMRDTQYSEERGGCTPAVKRSVPYITFIVVSTL
jgi:hypothetical protein